MKKLFFLLGFVCCLGFMSSAQQTVFLQDADAIEVLKDVQMTFQGHSVAATAAGSDFVLSSLKRKAAVDMLAEITDHGNSAQTVESYFSQPQFSDPRMSPSHVEETRTFILSLITKEGF